MLAEFLDLGELVETILVVSTIRLDYFGPSTREVRAHSVKTFQSFLES